MLYRFRVSLVYFRDLCMLLLCFGVRSGWWWSVIGYEWFNGFGRFRLIWFVSCFLNYWVGYCVRELNVRGIWFCLLLYLGYCVVCWKIRWRVCRWGWFWVVSIWWYYFGCYGC